tara:strand:- start:282 stop:683 length:402 start_codon:yes stop_codon:yes gene_type:complete
MNSLDVLDRLEQVTGGKGKWMACCPAHQDKSPSLAVTEAADRLLVYCFAGCETSDVMAAIGLNVADLFYNMLAGGELTEGKRRKYEEALISERFQVAIINSAERSERPLTAVERERRSLGQQRISKIEGILYE